MTPRKIGSMPGKGTTRRTIRIDDDLWTMVTEYADSVGENASSVIRNAIYHYTLSFPMSDAALAVADANKKPETWADENGSK